MISPFQFVALINRWINPSREFYRRDLLHDERVSNIDHQQHMRTQLKRSTLNISADVSCALKVFTIVNRFTKNTEPCWNVHLLMYSNTNISKRYYSRVLSWSLLISTCSPTRSFKFATPVKQRSESKLTPNAQKTKELAPSGDRKWRGFNERAPPSWLTQQQLDFLRTLEKNSGLLRSTEGFEQTD